EQRASEQPGGAPAVAYGRRRTRAAGVNAKEIQIPGVLAVGEHPEPRGSAELDRWTVPHVQHRPLGHQPAADLDQGDQPGRYGEPPAGLPPYGDPAGDEDDTAAEREHRTADHDQEHDDRGYKESDAVPQHPHYRVEQPNRRSYDQK